MKIIDSKLFTYLGSTRHREYNILNVDEDDAPSLVGDRIIKLHHFRNKQHEDELITVRECIYVLDDGKRFTFDSNNGYKNTDMLRIIDDFLDNPF